MSFFLLIFALLMADSQQELAAFGRCTAKGHQACRPTIVSSAQYRSFIMPKIFGGETPNELEGGAESTFPCSGVPSAANDCEAQGHRYSTVSYPTGGRGGQFQHVANHYYSTNLNQASLPQAYPTLNPPQTNDLGDYYQHLLPTSNQQQQQQYWHTTTPIPRNTAPLQQFTHSYYYSKQNYGSGWSAGAATASIPSYLEAIPLPKFQPASLGPPVVARSNVAAQRVAMGRNSKRNACCRDEKEGMMSPYARFLTMQQQEGLHELIVEARNNGVDEQRVAAFMARYVREVLPAEEYARFQFANQVFNQQRELRMQGHMGRSRRSTNGNSSIPRGPKNVPERIEIGNSRRDLHDFLNRPGVSRKVKELAKIESEA